MTKVEFLISNSASWPCNLYIFLSIDISLLSYSNSCLLHPTYESTIHGCQWPGILTMTTLLLNMAMRPAHSCYSRVLNDHIGTLVYDMFMVTTYE